MMKEVPYSCILVNNRFLKNEAISGGGIALANIDKFNHEIRVFQGNFFENNKALQGKGGAVYLQNVFDDIRLNNLEFIRNEASQSGGAVGGENISNQEWKNLTFFSNFAQKNGGGLHLEGEC